MIFLKRYKNYLTTHINKLNLYGYQKLSSINNLAIGVHSISQCIGITCYSNEVTVYVTYLHPYWNLNPRFDISNIHRIELIFKRRERIICYIIEADVNEKRSEISFLFKYNKYSLKASKNFMGVNSKHVYNSKICLCGKHDKSSRCLIL